MPYHPETNAQCERFNQTLISMIDTSKTKDKQCSEDYLPTLFHAYNCPKNNATDFSSYYLMYRWKHQLPIDIKFGLVSPQAEEYSHNKFLAKLNAQLKWCYELSDPQQCRESAHHKQ